MNHSISLTSHFRSNPILLIILFIFVSAVQAESSSTDPYTTSQIWGYGIAASVGVSLLGFVMAFILILILRIKGLGPAGLKLIITILISFAIGALLSDVIVHMMPEIFGSHSHEQDSHTAEEGEKTGDSETHEETETKTEEKAIPAICSLIILGGFGTFVLLEKLFEYLGISHSHGVDDGHAHHGHNHGHNHGHHHHNGQQKQAEKYEKSEKNERTSPSDKKSKSEEVGDLEEMKELPKQETIQQTEGLEKIEIHRVQVEASGVQGQQEEVIKVDLNENKSSSCLKTFCSFRGRKSGGIMILMADFIHNILDGLAIGVAFASGKRDLAVSTFVAVFAHEVPQEIGDMGILVESKFPIKQALMCNGVINFSALIGTFIGLGTGSLNEVANSYVLSYVAGNFLYISLVSMLPSVMKESQGKKAFLNLLAFIIGCGIMFAVLAAEADE